MTPGLRRAGVALLVIYAGVAVATFRLVTGPSRPLFDGFAPPVPYNWVRPPPELASTNVQPPAAEQSVPLGEQGLESAVASTPDAQMLLTLPPGAIPAHPPDAAVMVRITPRDATAVAALPPDLRPASNAYEVRLAYEPSQEPVTDVRSGAQVALSGGIQGDGLLYSSDGQAWQTVQARPFGNTHGMTGAFQGQGYYMVTASPAVTTTRALTDQPAGGGLGTALAVTAVVGAVAIAVAVFTTRARNNRSAPARKRATAARARRSGRRRGRS